jgi:hypothetical protein
MQKPLKADAAQKKLGTVSVKRCRNQDEKQKFARMYATHYESIGLVSSAIARKYENET